MQVTQPVAQRAGAQPAFASSERPRLVRQAELCSMQSVTRKQTPPDAAGCSSLSSPRVQQHQPPAQAWGSARWQPHLHALRDLGGSSVTSQQQQQRQETARAQRRASRAAALLIMPGAAGCTQGTAWQLCTHLLVPASESWGVPREQHGARPRELEAAPARVEGLWRELGIAVVVSPITQCCSREGSRLAEGFRSPRRREEDTVCRQFWGSNPCMIGCPPRGPS
jgi:hypothetical protein